MGAIEAVVKETARGRAFLAYYASKIRQSDTLTMLAMIGRPKVMPIWLWASTASHLVGTGTRRSKQIRIWLPLSEQMKKRSAR